MAPKKSSAIDLADDLTSEAVAPVSDKITYDDNQIEFAHNMLKKLRASANGKAKLASLIAKMSNGKNKIIENEGWHNLYLKRVQNPKTKEFEDDPIMALEYTQDDESMSIKECLEICASTGGFVMPHPSKKTTLTARNFRIKSDESEYYIGFTEDTVYSVF